MILFHQIVQVFTLPDGDLFFIRFPGVECGQRRRIGTAFIDDHDLWLTVVANGLAKEAQGSCSVTSGGQQEVDGLTCSIDSTVQIFPLAFDFYVGFIHSPSATQLAFMSVKGLIQERYQADDPAVKRGMINDNPTLCHYLFQI